MRLKEVIDAVMKSVFGTDERLRHRDERVVSDALLSDVETKVDRMKHEGDRLRELPARDVDEAMRMITGRKG